VKVASQSHCGYTAKVVPVPTEDISSLYVSRSSPSKRHGWTEVVEEVTCKRVQASLDALAQAQRRLLILVARSRELLNPDFDEISEGAAGC
jgi:hypothetical protein